MAYVALYRQWRPQDFDGLVGQEHISTTLKNAINAGRIGHAYLFAGPRGTGKTSTAKILAKALNCVHGPTAKPCNQCPCCERITAGESMDVLEIDAASNRGIDEIRDLRETIKFAPVDGKYKVYIIDEVHMLTTEAFNALLKTLEEPPAHVVFILATTEPHKIPATIHSRCQRYDFHRIEVREIQQRLGEVVAANDLQIAADALHLIAVHADGGMRDALSILDQCTTLETGQVTAAEVRVLLGLIGHEWVWRLAGAMANRDSGQVLLILDQLVNMGKDVRQVLVELALHGRSLMLFKVLPANSTGVEMYSEDQTVLSEQSAKFTHQELVDMIRLLHTAGNEAKWSPEPRITTEMALLSVCRRTATADWETLTERVAALEAKLAGTMPATTTVVTGATPATLPPARNQQPTTPPVHQSVSEPTRAAEYVTPSVSEPSASISSIAGGPSEVWDAVLKELVKEGKRSVHACISQGQLIALDQGQATVAFVAKFSKERSEREDFRIIIEKILAQVCGRSVRLNCVLGTPAGPVGSSVLPVTKSSDKHPPKVVEHKPGTPPAVREALSMFGGTILEEKITEEGKP